ncbi:hypothetical protein BDSB_29560 [Burkholderia dolosa PC543]|nr:hypothetical protein BDSB_29560 [Burkholderia dolosa PC543]
MVGAASRRRFPSAERSPHFLNYYDAKNDIVICINS